MFLSGAGLAAALVAGISFEKMASMIMDFSQVLGHSSPLALALLLSNPLVPKSSSPLYYSL